MTSSSPDSIITSVSNSEQPSLSEPTPLTPEQVIHFTSLSPTYWLDAPLEEVFQVSNNQTLLHELPPESLMNFVKRCASLRMSAQTQKAAMREAPTKQKKAKSSVDLAAELLKGLLG